MNIQAQKAFSVSLVVSIYVNTVLVVIKEMHRPFKAFLHGNLINHWVGHCIVLLLFFVLFALLLKRANVKFNLASMPLQLLLSILISFVGISVFYLNNVH